MRRVGRGRQASSVALGAAAEARQAAAESAQSLALILSASNTVRYTTDAARAAANPTNGNWGWAADVGNYRHRENGVWVSYDPAPPPPDTGVY